jgi:hypothetical protein
VRPREYEARADRADPIRCGRGDSGDDMRRGCESTTMRRQYVQVAVNAILDPPLSHKEHNEQYTPRNRQCSRTECST